GLLFTLTHDLTEILECTLLLAALLALQKCRPIWATVALTLAVLAREPAVLLAAGAAIAWGIDAIRARLARRPFPQASSLLVGIVPTVVYLAFHFYIVRRWGSAAGLDGTNSLNAPFIGIWRFVGVHW